MLEWGEKATKKYVAMEKSQLIHDKAKPFLKWLQEAEEESGESENESDVEIEYDDRARVDSLKSQVKPAQPAKKPVEEDDENDVDIDAI